MSVSARSPGERFRLERGGVVVVAERPAAVVDRDDGVHAVVPAVEVDDHEVAVADRVGERAAEEGIGEEARSEEVRRRSRRRSGAGTVVG